jgi:predicted dehydrogenase
MTTHLALVGGAHIHTPGFIRRINARDDVAVTCVWDHDAARAARRAEALDAQVVDDVDAIWDDDEIPAVVICSETYRHEPLVLAAAAAGKHLFVEKPLGMDAEDANRMADAVEQVGVRFQTGYFMRGNPIHRFLKAQIEAGTFGTVTRYRGSNCHAGSLKGWFDTEWRWMADPEQAGCGAFGDLGTHALDIMLWLLGDVTRVTASLGVATGRYGDCDEYGEGLLRFANGAVGSLAAGWVDIADPVKLLISGTEAHAHVLNGQLFLKSDNVPGADGETPWTDLPAPWPHAFELFLDAVTGASNVPLVPVREAAYRSTVMAAMYQAAKDHTWHDVAALER